MTYSKITTLDISSSGLHPSTGGYVIHRPDMNGFFILDSELAATTLQPVYVQQNADHTLTTTVGATYTGPTPPFGFPMDMMYVTPKMVLVLHSQGYLFSYIINTDGTSAYVDNISWASTHNLGTEQNELGGIIIDSLSTTGYIYYRTTPSLGGMKVKTFTYNSTTGDLGTLSDFATAFDFTFEMHGGPPSFGQFIPGLGGRVITSLGGGSGNMYGVKLADDPTAYAHTATLGGLSAHGASQPGSLMSIMDTQGIITQGGSNSEFLDRFTYSDGSGFALADYVDTTSMWLTGTLFASVTVTPGNNTETGGLPTIWNAVFTCFDSSFNVIPGYVAVFDVFGASPEVHQVTSMPTGMTSQGVAIGTYYYGSGDLWVAIEGDNSGTEKRTLDIWSSGSSGTSRVTKTFSTTWNVVSLPPTHTIPADPTDGVSSLAPWYVAFKWLEGQVRKYHTVTEWDGNDLAGTADGGSAGK